MLGVFHALYSPQHHINQYGKETNIFGHTRSGGASGAFNVGGVGAKRKTSTKEVYFRRYAGKHLRGN